MKFERRNIKHIQTKTQQFISEKSNRPWIVGTVAAVIISSTISINAYIDYRKEAKNTSADEVIKDIEFPSKGFHYEIIPTAPYTEGSLELFISLTSKESRSAYTQARNFANNNGLELSIRHLSQNPEWELAANTFHALSLIKPDIILDDYFNAFSNSSREHEIRNKINELLIKDEISQSTFESTLTSIETIRSVNDDLEKSNKLNIDFIPSIVLHGNRIIYFGLFNSYSDSLRLHKATKEGKASPTKDDKQDAGESNN